MNLIIILGVLVIALVIIIPFIEKSSIRMDSPVIAKLSRWIIPALILIAVMQLLFHLFSYDQTIGDSEGIVAKVHVMTIESTLVKIV